MSYENYNNGVSPEPGLVWDGGGWVYPTTGYIGGDTLTVWPESSARYPVESFNPDTGGGFVPTVDGVWENPLPSLFPEMQTALSQVTQGLTSPQWDNFISAPFWRFTPALAYPTPDNTVNPYITMLPLKQLTHTPVSAGSAAPASVMLHTRITDDVRNGVQYLAAVGDQRQQSFNVPVRQASYKGSNTEAFFAGMMPGSLGFLEFYIYSTSKEGTRPWNTSVEQGELLPAGATAGANTQDLIVWFPAESGMEPLYVAFTTSMPAAQLQRRAEQQAQAQLTVDDNKLKDSAKAVVDFYQLATERAGAQISQAAKTLADSVQGKQIRNAEEAYAAFQEYGNVLNNKYSVADREAIAQALEAVDKQTLSENLVRLSKGLGYTSKLIDGYDIVGVELPKTLRTGDWRPFFVTVGGIYLGVQAAHLTALAFGALLTTPAGIIAYVALLTATSAFVNDTVMLEIKRLVGL